MKISILLGREPFEKIFEKTMASFLKDFTGYHHNVNWHSKNQIKDSHTSKRYWLCNPLINSIFVNGANQKIFNSINGEYLENPLRPWLNIIQKLYLFLSQNYITAPLLSKYNIDIMPPIKGAKNKLIIGGNTKIRMIDVEEGRVYVILKIGFDREYLDKEVFVRKKFKYLSTPKIYNTGNNANWYSEGYISGVSSNRLELNRGREALNEVLIGIHRMLNDTKDKQSLSEYALQLEDRIFAGLKKIKHFEGGGKQKIINFTIKLSKELKKHSNKTITTAYCHGDFHQGNILCDEKKNWVLDWENSGLKQIGYDLLILLVESRISNGFFTRFSKLINNQFDSYQWELINNWPNINWENKESKEVILLLFLLEELDFHIIENTNELFYSVSKVLVDRYVELEMCLNEIIVNNLVN